MGGIPSFFPWAQSIPSGLLGVQNNAQAGYLLPRGKECLIPLLRAPCGQHRRGTDGIWREPQQPDWKDRSLSPKAFIHSFSVYFNSLSMALGRALSGSGKTDYITVKSNSNNIMDYIHLHATKTFFIHANPPPSIHLLPTSTCMGIKGKKVGTPEISSTLQWEGNNEVKCFCHCFSLGGKNHVIDWEPVYAFIYFNGKPPLHLRSAGSNPKQMYSDTKLLWNVLRCKDEKR